MMLDRVKKGVLLLILIALFVTTSVMLRQQADPMRQDGAHFFRMAGAIRVFAMDAIWMRMSAHQQEGNESLVLSDARTLLALDPDSAAIRAFLFRHLAMTMARKAASEVEAQAWIREGLAILDDGLALEEGPLPAHAAFALHRARGLAFFIRSENPDPAFTQVCESEYGSPPILLAHSALAKALEARDDENTRLFHTASLWNAARFEMRHRRYAHAAELWKKANASLPFWLEAMEAIDTHEELTAFYRDVEAYCALAGEAKKEGENAARHDKTLKELKERIKASRFCDLTDEIDDGSP